MKSDSDLRTILLFVGLGFCYSLLPSGPPPIFSPSPQTAQKSGSSSKSTPQTELKLSASSGALSSGALSSGALSSEALSSGALQLETSLLLFQKINGELASEYFKSEDREVYPIRRSESSSSSSLRNRIPLEFRSRINELEESGLQAFSNVSKEVIITAVSKKQSEDRQESQRGCEVFRLVKKRNNRISVQPHNSLVLELRNRERFFKVKAMDLGEIALVNRSNLKDELQFRINNQPNSVCGYTVVETIPLERELEWNMVTKYLYEEGDQSSDYIKRTIISMFDE